MNKIDYKEFARQMRERCAKDYYGNIVCSPELWEEIAKMIDDVAPIQKMLWELKEAVIWHNWKRVKKIIKFLEGRNFEPIEKLISREYDEMIAKDIVAVMKKYFPDSKINEKRVLQFAKMILENETEGTNV